MSDESTKTPEKESRPLVKTKKFWTALTVLLSLIGTCVVNPTAIPSAIGEGISAVTTLVAPDSSSASDAQ